MTLKPYPVTDTSDQARMFTDAAEAVAYVREIYDNNTAYLRECLVRLSQGEKLDGEVFAGYPYVAITTSKLLTTPPRLSYGFVPTADRYSTTLTRPDIFSHYYTDQFAQLLHNHDVPLEVGVSDCPIPIHFAFRDGMAVEGEMNTERVAEMRERFDLPDIAIIDDSIANGTHLTFLGEEHPLALFTAPRVDYSLHRLRHYTGTDPACFQNFVLFTNYQFYVDEFVRMSMQIMERTSDEAEANYRKQYTCLVEPGGYTTYNANISDREPQGERSDRMPQMPAYHLMREDGCGITIVNIGVGPSNARNISDHVAVLRPHAWMTLGHCAGLRQSQKLGDYVLAHGYVRDDHALDKELPLWVPIPALAEVQLALEAAVCQCDWLDGFEDQDRHAHRYGCDDRQQELGNFRLRGFS